jgi:uncharacterized HAD superfamily protein
LAVNGFDGITHFNWWEIPNSGLSKEDVDFYWLKKSSLDIVSRDSDAYKIIQGLSADKQFSIVTARNDLLQKISVEHWVQENYPMIPKDQIYFANHIFGESRPKSQICKDKNITLFIDDAIHNAQDLVTSGIPCILLEKPWNRDIEYDHPLLYRVKDWNTLSQALQHV